MRQESIKIIEENIGSNLFDIGHSNFFQDVSKGKGNKSENELLGLHQDQRLLHSKGNSQQNRGNPRNGRRYSQMTLQTKGWYPRSIKNSSTLKKQIIMSKNGQKTWTNNSPKKISRWPTDRWKDVQQYSSSGKYKSKILWDITSHLSEWLKSTTQETTGVGENVEKKESSCIFGGNVNLSTTVENTVEVPQKVHRTTI